MKVYNNKGSGGRADNVYFDPESRVYSGGLLEGSDIGVRSKKSSKAVKNITQYEYDTFFTPDNGRLTTSIRSVKDETFYASVFADKEVWFIIAMAVVVILLGYVGKLVGRRIIRKHKTDENKK